MKLLMAALLALTISSASIADEDRFECIGFDASNGELIEFEAQITPDYFIIDYEIVFEYIDQEETYFVYGKEVEGELFLMMFETLEQEYYMLSMPLNDFEMGYVDRTIIYSFGNCNLSSL